MDNKLLLELKLFFNDHYNQFGCYPLDFEYKGIVYSWEQCWDILKGEA